MKKENLLRFLIGVIFVSIVGTIMHFTYEWSGNNRLVGLFAATNESTWEHMKLLFFPMLLYAILEAFFIHPGIPDKAATGVGILAGTGLIPILFYTYSGILGYHLAAFDISIFFISVMIAFSIRFRGMKSGKYEKFFLIIFILVILLWASFFLFTYSAPDIGIFQVPTRVANNSLHSLCLFV